mmetsp:Transcript_25156/g.29635  ORF Transcript_25156/g.29635 Transcript_25156/m.29635 type:complete len:92 (-) Transcript_25156:568-843(-)
MVEHGSITSTLTGNMASLSSCATYNPNIHWTIPVAPTSRDYIFLVAPIPRFCGSLPGTKSSFEDSMVGDEDGKKVSSLEPLPCPIFGILSW